MEQQAYLFKDDTLNGISISIQNLQHQEAEAKSGNSNVSHMITKYNPHFRNLINFLDLTFSFGLKDAKKGYWPFVRKIAHSCVIDMVEKHKHAVTEVKKGYIWLFLTFIENSLDAYIRLMVSNLKLLRYYYKNYALLRDSERCEVLFNLLKGIETFTFSITFEEPYLDFGHDPILRQEKIIIRVHPNTLINKADEDSREKTSSQPDVTIIPPGVKTSAFPDLLEAQQNLLFSNVVHSSPKHRRSVDVCNGQDLNMDLVQHVSTKRRAKKIIRTLSVGAEIAEGQSLDGESTDEMAEDNYIPETLGSPEYALCLSDEEADVFMNTKEYIHGSGAMTKLTSSDPMIKSFSEGDAEYQLFLEGYKKEGNIEEEASNHQQETQEKKECRDEDDSDEDLMKPVTPVEDKIQKLSLCESQGYRFAYVSDGEEDCEAEDADVEDLHNENAEEIGIDRSDSFDRFCRKGSSGSSSPDDDFNTFIDEHRSEVDNCS